MVALLIIAAVVSVLAGVFAMIVHQLSVAQRRQYREDLALNNLACPRMPKTAKKAGAQKAGTMKAKPRLPAGRPQQARATGSHPNSALLLR